MPRVISVFNNKGGVGKSTICWNLAHALGKRGCRTLLIDFDPQCNLSIAMLGEKKFVDSLPTQNAPYGTTVRAFLQRFLQNTGGEEIFLHQGQHTDNNVHLIAGDFWLNIYADTLSVGGDLLSGTGLSRYVALRRVVDKASEQLGADFDYVLIDLPPSFGSLVRAAFYSSDYYIVPCTSDNFSVYCVGLIGQMVPSFVKDWQSGLDRFQGSNPHFRDYDKLGQPKFAGWVFNGFDTARRRRTQQELRADAPLGEKEMVQADRTMHDHLVGAIKNTLIDSLNSSIDGYKPVVPDLPENFRIGDLEDANVLIQNSLWLSVPLGELHRHEQVASLQDRRRWALNQIDQIHLLGDKLDEMAGRLLHACG